MTSAEVATELKYSSPVALNLSRRKGVLPLRSVRIPGHKSEIYKTRDVAFVLTTWIKLFEQENPM